MNFLQEPIFKALFNNDLPRIILRADEPNFTIIAYNEAYKIATHTTERDVMGMFLWDAYNPKDAGGDGGITLLNALSGAIKTKETILMDPFKYDVLSSDQTKLEPSWWQLEILPIVVNTGSEIEYLLITTLNITEKISTNKVIKEGLAREQNLTQHLATSNEELAATNEELLAKNEELLGLNQELSESQFSLKKLNEELEERVAYRTKVLVESELNLRNLVMNSHYALLILKGDDWVIEIANQQVANMWSKPLDVITGNKLLDVLPEIKDQPFPNLLQEVYKTGLSVAQEEQVFYLNTAEGTIKKYVSFYYDPIFDADGKVNGVIVSSQDITDRIADKNLLEQSYEEQQVLNEEISVSNEELAATNEELAATNEELTTTIEELAIIQQKLQDLVSKLASSEARAKYMLSDAPVGIGVFNGADFIIETANTMFLKYLGKTENILGLRLNNALPELENQAFFQILNDVFETGKSYNGNEVKVVSERNGNFEEDYYNFVFQPFKDNEGKTESIMIVVREVTTQVVAKKQLQTAEELLRFSIEAANVGTWTLQTDTKKLIASPRLKELFGFKPDEELTYELAIAQITEQYRDKVLEAIENTIKTNVNYNIEYPVIGFHDQKLRWLRGLGKLDKNIDGNVSHFSGVSIDITEQKQDELRKNDFIGMVSHELKTPLTTLSGYLQMLQAKTKENKDDFIDFAFNKTNQQVKIMNGMINGFLDVSRLESGKIFLNKQQFNLDELVDEIIEETAVTSPKYVFRKSLAKKIPVFADKEKMASVVSNLLSNAIKYSPKGEIIEVSCYIVDDNAQVYVKDQGIGIVQHDIEKLFERFYRVESQQTQHIAGFGIGLYLSAEIIERHNGKIWVESELEKGSKFYFELPLSN